MRIKINKSFISKKNPTYFIADIAAHHDGSLSWAKNLIRLCAKAGADAAKFQHFKAETIISKKDLEKLEKNLINLNGKKAFLKLIKMQVLIFHGQKH